MAESLMLFEQISNSGYYNKAALLILFTNMDYFSKRIRSGMSPIHKYFPDYQGRPTDVLGAQDFFAKKFRNLVPQSDIPREVYIHFVNSTDTDLLRKIMGSLQDMIVQTNVSKLRSV
jgi:guanine nucleotide-binding protein subunit alpha, other